jgi:hypothetical protein
MKVQKFYTIGQAAEATGKAKSTIKKSIDNSELSVAEKTSRGFKIEASELDRVFPFLNDERTEKRTNAQIETGDNTPENSVLSVKVEMLHEQLERTDLDREREREQASKEIENLKEQLARQSADHRQALAAITDQRQNEPKRKWWSFR